MNGFLASKSPVVICLIKIFCGRITDCRSNKKNTTNFFITRTPYNVHLNLIKNNKKSELFNSPNFFSVAQDSVLRFRIPIFKKHKAQLWRAELRKCYEMLRKLFHQHHLTNCFKVARFY